MDYRVDLDAFGGPMDLLLYLVRKDEVDLHDIPIARILEQFLEHVKLLSSLDVDGIGDFLVMASTLMEIKSRMLLPREEESEESEEDPRLDLVQKLIEYRRFKEVSEELGDFREEQKKKFPRGMTGTASGEEEEERTIPIGEVSLWDLCAAYAGILGEIRLQAGTEIVFDDTPIEEHIERVLERVEGAGCVPFRSLFSPEEGRGVLVGTFLAILELIRQGKLRVFQERDFAEILVARREEIGVETPAGSRFVDERAPDA